MVYDGEYELEQWIYEVKAKLLRRKKELFKRHTLGLLALG
jgi:hypothetical protein